MADKSGMSNLFPSFPREMSVWDRCVITIKRHQNNYFLGWSQERLNGESVPEMWRPLPHHVPMTEDAHKTNVKKNEATRNKKLTYCIEQSLNQENGWAVDFKKEIQEDKFKSITEVKDQASELWRQHSSVYDSVRAVHIPSMNGHGHRIKKSRRSTENETDYRRRIKQQRVENHEETSNDKVKVVASMKEKLERIFTMKRGQLNIMLEEREATLERIRQETDIPTRTVEECKLAVSLAIVYEAL